MNEREPEGSSSSTPQTADEPAAGPTSGDRGTLSREFGRWRKLAPILAALLPALAFGQSEGSGKNSVDLTKLSLEELNDVEVTSVSRQPEPYRQAASAVYVITRDAIRRSGATSIPEALRLAPNLNVAQKSASDWAVSARGFNANVGDKLLVLIDGRVVYTPLFSGVIWSAQDYLLEDIDRIEVISGPGGTLWGANAVNGVINIITRSSADTQGSYLEAGGGTELQGFAGFRFGGTLAPGVSYRLYGKYTDRAPSILPGGADAADAMHSGQGGFRIDARPSLDTTFTLQGDTYSGSEHLETGGIAELSGGNVLARWTRSFSSDSSMSLQTYYDRTHISDPFPASAAVNAPFGYLTDRLDTIDVDFQHHFRLSNRHKIVWGLGYRRTHETDENAGSVAFLPETLSQNLFSGFAQDEITLLDQLFLTLGTKVEHNDYTGFEFEPNIRLRLNLGPNAMLWGAVSRAVRTPARYDRDLFEPNPIYGVFLAGNDSFASETLVAYELGYRVQPAPPLSASISAFYNQYSNLRSAGFTPVTFLPLFFQNGDEADSYGVEVNATYQVLGWWRLQGGYTFLREHVRAKPGEIDLFNALNETADPEHQVSLRTSMDLPHHLEAEAGLRRVDTLIVNDGGTAGTVPGYWELDVRLAWHATKKLELSIVGQNLLHAHHPEYGFPGPTRQELQRGVYGKAAWRF
jgi:iron complex outermembrane recepter protein